MSQYERQPKLFLFLFGAVTRKSISKRERELHWKLWACCVYANVIVDWLTLDFLCYFFFKAESINIHNTDDTRILLLNKYFMRKKLITLKRCKLVRLIFISILKMHSVFNKFNKYYKILSDSAWYIWGKKSVTKIRWPQNYEFILIIGNYEYLRKEFLIKKKLTTSNILVIYFSGYILCALSHSHSNGMLISPS